MKMNILKGLLLLVVLLTEFGCPKPVENFSVSGNYAGTVKSGSGGQTSTMTMVLVQNDNQVTGTYTITGSINESGTVTGNILGLIFDFTLRRILPTAGSFSGSINISNGTDKLTGSYGNGLYIIDLTRK